MNKYKRLKSVIDSMEESKKPTELWDKIKEANELIRHLCYMDIENHRAKREE